MLHTYLTLVAEEGLRPRSDALWLRWEDLDLDEGFVHVVSGRDGHRTETRRSPYVPVTRALWPLLQRHARRYRDASAWVFHDEVTGDRLTDLLAPFKRAVRSLGGRVRPDVVLYDLRHRRATTWLQQGMDVTLVQKAVGHASIVTTMRYTHLVRDDLRGLQGPPEAEFRAQLRQLVG